LRSVLPDAHRTCYSCPRSSRATHPSCWRVLHTRGGHQRRAHPHASAGAATPIRRAPGSDHDPLRDRRVSPPGHDHDVGVIAGEVAAMDWFMMRDPVNAAPAPRVSASPRPIVPTQGPRPGARALVLTGQQEPPEAEKELGDHAAGRLGLDETTNPVSSRRHVLAGLLRKHRRGSQDQAPSRSRCHAVDPLDMRGDRDSRLCRRRCGDRRTHRATRVPDEERVVARGPLFVKVGPPVEG
jgi:hypothetical protein